MSDIENFWDRSDPSDDSGIDSLDAIIPAGRSRPFYRRHTRPAPDAKRQPATPQGAALLRLLSEHGYSNTKFAVRLGINSRSADLVSRWCVTGLPKKHAAAAAQALNCAPELIVREYRTTPPAAR